MADVYRGDAGKNAVSAERLAAFFEDKRFDGALYIGYPIVSTPEGPHRLDALLVSPSKGLVAFHLVEGIGDNLSNSQALEEARRRQDDDCNKLEAKLRLHPALMKGRDLLPPIASVTFAPVLQLQHSVSDDIPNEPDIFHEEADLGEWLEQLDEWPQHGSYQALLAAIESISSIRKGVERAVGEEDSLGRRLQDLEDSVAHQDVRQAKAVIETTEGVQRIRGLAGSGKTIVLARKAAYLHTCHPDWRIAVTFHTRSLKGQLRRYINRFTFEQGGREPDWDKLQVIHAWGAPGGGEREGLYHKFCEANDVDYQTFGSAADKFGRSQALEGACKEALEASPTPEELYDVMLVDEAQDLPPSFLRMCYKMLPREKRLVYAYDELQNLDTESLPSPEEIFGKDPSGSPVVTFSAESEKAQSDIILDKCYRNSRPVLATAHALGFGIYREPEDSSQTGLVQIFDRPELWEEVGYKVEAGDLAGGKQVTLARTPETSPLFLEEHSALEELIQFRSFASSEEQDEWVAQAIEKNLERDKLRHEDIVVIHPSPLSARRAVGGIRENLGKSKIKSHFAGVTTSPDVFSVPESIAVSGIYRAKGNEVGMVYVVNAQECFLRSPTRRNQLFTAITRSKAWVRVLGHGEGMERLVREFQQLRKNDFKLRFRYPTAKEQQQLKTLGREEKATVQRGRAQKAKKLLGRVLAGEIQLEDLPPQQRDLLEGLATDGQSK